MRRSFEWFLAWLRPDREPEITDCGELRFSWADMVWLKGNLHAHTDRSDGDVSPLEAARWYEANGYDFLVISDHNLQVPLQPVRDQLGPGRLMLIPGEELTTWWPNVHRTLALHVGAVGVRGTLGPSSGESVIGVLEASLRKVQSQGGIAILNHPNFWDSITPEEMMSLSEITHLEIFNGHPLTFSQGTARLPPVEQTWDQLLTAGRRVFGVAVDDAHDYRAWGPAERNPGRGWVVVEADGKNEDEVMAALAEGRFFASTGPSLVAVAVRDATLEVEAPGPGQIEFISKGEVVGSYRGRHAQHPIPEAGYLRARFRDGSGVAWTQPVFR